MSGNEAEHDLVDIFRIPFVRALGNLVITFAQAEAALLTLIMFLQKCDEKAAQDLLKQKTAKAQADVTALASIAPLDGYDRQEVTATLAEYWSGL